MSDDKIESFDDAASAATNGSPEVHAPHGSSVDGPSALERDGDLPGETLAGMHPADRPDQPEPAVNDPEAEELTDTSAPHEVDVDGVDDEQQLDRATEVAASARSSRPVRRTTPALDASEADPVGAGGVAAAPSRRPSRSARPVRRATPLAAGADDRDGAPAGSAAAHESLQQEVGGVSPMASAAAALSADRSDGSLGADGTSGSHRADLRPRRRSGDAELATTDEPARPSRRDVDHETHRRVGPAEFVRQSAAELRKVIWPTGSELGQYFIVVLAFVLSIIALVEVLDVFFGWVLLKLFGTK